MSSEPGPANPGAHPGLPGRASTRTRFAWCALACAFLAADLWTKHIVFYPYVLHPYFHEGVVTGHPWDGWTTDWWQTRLVYNQGVTFGAFEWVPWWGKSLVTGAVIVWLAMRLWAVRAGKVAEPLSLAMIVGGAVGNLYDRALRPYVEADTRPGVRDFLDWYAPPGSALAGWLEKHEITTHWYTSNVADVCIVCGVILLAITMFREGDPEDAPPKPAGAGPSAEAKP